MSATTKDNENVKPTRTPNAVHRSAVAKRSDSSSRGGGTGENLHRLVARRSGVPDAPCLVPHQAAGTPPLLLTATASATTPTATPIGVSRRP